ncbi:acetyl-CoA hydrolase/transferase C-terminal domain-containing protein [Desulfatitalea tepidiphila]|uniref:acetyl-CoA hydrolase/transferase C-terminal domain-containing protein n=1 Tax=Desulfatitalea tepidiphila TaxID=1185843 RepID=UPI0006B67B6B|nr:acetyl-CoA hydrolase/transferase C-terminal domain-containing protein [Desulfatitalea tepidiphila]
MENKQPLYLDVEQTVDHIIDNFGNDIKIGMPLGLGKPVPLINALYQRVKKDPALRLTIYTALSLEKPVWHSDLERRFLEPVVNRAWEGVPDLDYLMDLRKGDLPTNVTIRELFCKAGAYRHNPIMQQNFMSTNYTHTVRDCDAYQNDIFAQIIAKKDKDGDTIYSTSCNADTALETLGKFRRYNQKGIKKLSIGMVNANLPFMHGDAEVPADIYDIIIDDPDLNYPLFQTPRQPVSVPDYMIGLHVSTLIKDGGTLQIGIGALGDAIAYGLNLRNNQNEAYRKLLDHSGISATYGDLINSVGGTGTFEEGLYGSTEMLVDGFLQLYKGGVIKRKVYHHAGVQRLINEGKLKDQIPPEILAWMIEQETLHPYLTRKDFEALQHVGVFKAEAVYANGEIICDGRRFSALLADAENLRAVSDNCLGSALKNGVVLTGAFFIGPKDFYDTLNHMPEEEQNQFEMTGVEVANQLYGNETLRALQRKDGRFCNTGMKATVLGHVSSDMLEDGTVISGVGGQYNFVSMAHALPDGRLVMMIKGTRQEKGKTLSNIVYNYGNVTIPRHLKDIIVTEYGIADLRGKCDQDVIKAMLNITDARFQEALLSEAKKNNKIPQDYEIPEQFRHNTPERLAETLKAFKAMGLFPDFPFGSMFTDVELMIAYALKVLKAKAAGPDAESFPEIMKQLPIEIPDNLQPFMVRMGLAAPATPEEMQTHKMLLLAFRLAGFC